MNKSVTGGIMVPHPPIILPNVGRGEEKRIAQIDAAYKQAAETLEVQQPDTIVIVTPHAPSYADYIQLSAGDGAMGSMAQFGDPQDAFSIRYDQALVSEIEKLAGQENFPMGTLGRQDGTLDHGTMVPLYYLKDLIPSARFVRVGIGGPDHLSHYHAGKLIAKAAENLGRKIAFVASGDLSHCQKAGTNYGYKACGPAYDEKIMKIMGDADFAALLETSEKEADEAMVCGHKPFCVMAGAMDGLKPEAEALAHSAEFGVGYGVCTYQDLKEDPARCFEEPAREEIERRRAKARAREDEYVKLARAAVEEAVRNHRVLPVPQGLCAQLEQDRAGAFVSIHENGQLRGCIGTTEPTRENLAMEIIANGISAATRDPRFYPIRPEELDALEIKVDVLKSSEKISSKDELDVHKYGVIVTKGTKRGLLLPDLEGIDTVDQQIAIAKQKAGIPESDQDVELERFEVVRHV